MHPVTKTQLLPEEMSMPRSLRSRSQSGFSLLEMLVAITITMIIMGSVYGLMTQSQSSFAREPMLADRQQQARGELFGTGEVVPMKGLMTVSLVENLGTLPLQVE